MVSNYLTLGRAHTGTAAGTDTSRESFANSNLPARVGTVRSPESQTPSPPTESGLSGRLYQLAASTTPSCEVGAVQMLLRHYMGGESPVTALMTKGDVASALGFMRRHPGADLALAKGAEGALVRDVQQRLVTLGLLEGNPTGRLLEKTEAAIARFQASIPALASQESGVLTTPTLMHLLHQTKWSPEEALPARGAGSLRGTPSPPSLSKDFDHTLLAKMEGDFRTKGYVLPPKEYPHAGITISNGVDLGQWSKSDLLRIGVSPALVEKISPYLNASLRGEAAEIYLKKHPLEISPSESKHLYEKVFSKILTQFAQTYDKNRGSDGPQFADLPAELKTALGSMAFNMGASFTEVTGTGTFSKWRRAIGDQIFAGNFEKVFTLLVANPHREEGLRNRRHKEAAIVLHHLAGHDPVAAGRLVEKVETALSKAATSSVFRNFAFTANTFQPGLLAALPDQSRSSERDNAQTVPIAERDKVGAHREQPLYHSVKKGDTLSEIAERFDCNVAEIKRINRLKTDHLTIGQKLRLPTKTVADASGAFKA